VLVVAVGTVTTLKANALENVGMVKTVKENQSVYRNLVPQVLEPAKGGKKAIANAVKRKKANDPNPNRKGKAKHVNNNPKK
jgi:hypothetical protein